MATVEQVILADSLDERIKSNVETVTFYHPLTGAPLEIELGEANRKHFENHVSKLNKYIDAAREVEAREAAPAKKNLSPVREWAKANGYDVGERGRIKAEILEAYDKAQTPTAVKDDKVILTVTPEAQLDDIVTEPEVEADSMDSIVDADDLVEVEFPQNEIHPESKAGMSTDELAEFLRNNMDADGKVAAEALKV